MQSSNGSSYGLNFCRSAAGPSRWNLPSLCCCMPQACTYPLSMPPVLHVTATLSALLVTGHCRFHARHIRCQQAVFAWCPHNHACVYTDTRGGEGARQGWALIKAQRPCNLETSWSPSTPPACMRCCSCPGAFCCCWRAGSVHYMKRLGPEAALPACCSVCSFGIMMLRCQAMPAGGAPAGVAWDADHAFWFAHPKGSLLMPSKYWSGSQHRAHMLAHAGVPRRARTPRVPRT